MSDHDHRPYPAPPTPFVMHMMWLDLLFAHWRVPAAVLRPLIPPALALDEFDGSAWIGVVPFRMSGVRPRLAPSVPGLSDFPELNVRTYVTKDGKPGVWFFSLDAANRLAVRAARRVFHLPYMDAEMVCLDAPSPNPSPLGRGVKYSSHRTHKGEPPADFAAAYGPTGEVFHAQPGSLEHFLTARYCLYAADAQGRVYRGEIDHPDWPLQPAWAEIERNTMTGPIGLTLPADRPHLLFTRKLDVVAWLPQIANCELRIANDELRGDTRHSSLSTQHSTLDEHRYLSAHPVLPGAVQLLRLQHLRRLGRFVRAVCAGA
jgi:hypothetical protein